MKSRQNGILKRGTVLWLSLKDLRHELLVTINLLLGTAAIIAPLLILFGIKFGTIETMRNRLLNDPRNLEIRPLSSRSYDKEWFHALEKDPRIAFATPLTRKLASTVTLYAAAKKKRIKADLSPTGDGDPLLLQNGGTIPHGRHAVLSSESAKALGVEAGGKVRLVVSRYLHGRIEKVGLNLKIDAVLKPRAGFLKMIYLPLDLADKIEHYKDGVAVEEFGWKGTLPVAHSVYDGLFIALPKPLDRIEQIRLTSGTGFSSIKALSTSEAKKIAGYTFDKHLFIYLAKPFKNRVTQTNIDAMHIKIRGRGATLFPWIEPLEVHLQHSGKVTKMELYAAPDSWKLKPDRFYLDDISAGSAEMRISEGEKSLKMPVKLEELPYHSPFLFVASKRAGEIALLRERDLEYDSLSGRLLILRRGYAGFRIYARTLEDVEKLKEYFETKGIEVSTKAERIHDVRQLDRYLTLIFWLIAAVGVLGGTATLGASLYASVERKRRELSILRLLGLSRRALFRFPLYQGILIAIGGVVLALFFFLLMARLINHLFSGYLAGGESFCTLSLWHIWLVLLFTILTAVTASALAAVKATRSDPAEAMRDE